MQKHFGNVVFRTRFGKGVDEFGAVDEGEDAFFYVKIDYNLRNQFNAISCFLVEEAAQRTANHSVYKLFVEKVGQLW